MTLDTRVYVLDKIDHREIFAKCNQLIGAHEGVVSTDEEYGSITGWRAGQWCISNKPDQGLCAWLMIYYRPDAALVTPEQAAECNEDCEPDAEFPEESYHYHLKECWLEVSMDTTYGYRGPDGGCGDLHARIVAELGQWLDGKNVRWRWENEFTGEVFDSYEGLTKLGSGGAEASAWFTNIVKPALIAEHGPGIEFF